MALAFALQIDFDRCPNCQSYHVPPIPIADRNPSQIFLVTATYDRGLSGKKLNEGFLRVWEILACNTCKAVAALRDAMITLWITRTLVRNGRIPVCRYNFSSFACDLRADVSSFYHQNEDSSVIDLTNTNANTNEAIANEAIANEAITNEDPHTCGVCLEGDINPAFDTKCNRCSQFLHAWCFEELSITTANSITPEYLIHGNSPDGFELMNRETGEIYGIAVDVKCPFCRGGLGSVDVPEELIVDLLHGQLKAEYHALTEWLRREGLREYNLDY